MQATGGRRRIQPSRMPTNLKVQSMILKTAQTPKMAQILKLAPLRQKVSQANHTENARCG